MNLKRVCPLGKCDGTGWIDWTRRYLACACNTRPCDYDTITVKKAPQGEAVTTRRCVCGHLEKVHLEVCWGPQPDDAACCSCPGFELDVTGFVHDDAAPLTVHFVPRQIMQHVFFLPRVGLIAPGTKIPIGDAVGTVVHLGHDEIVRARTERVVFVARQVHARKNEALLDNNIEHAIDTGMRWVLEEGEVDPT